MPEQAADTSGRVSRALSALLPVVREGGPITLLFVLVLAGISLYFLNSQLNRQQDTTERLVQMLLVEKDARLADAIKCMSGRGS